MTTSPLPGGALGKILWVNLTTGELRPESVPPEVYDRFLGGLGLAAYYLYQRIPAYADPLGAENILAFVPGSLTATGSLMTGRWMVAAKSPLTHTWGDANCGGTFAPAIRQAGYDGIFFTGISPKPVYLWLQHGDAELRDASALWGMDSYATDSALKSLDPAHPLSVACIGPAGERLSLISGIVNDGGRLAARSGLGAVMGSKRLKAVVAQGSYAVPVAHPQQVERLSRTFARVAGFQPPFFSGTLARLLGTFLRILPLQMRQDGMLYKFFLGKFGTVGLNQYSIETGDAPIRNWAGSSADFPPARSASVNPDAFRAREDAKYHCYSCPVGCGGSSPFRGKESHKPEYETVNAFGGLLLNEDLESIFAANDLLNRAGMDSISAGGTVAFAIESAENGLFSPADLVDFPAPGLTWGNSAAILALLRKMIAREGIGDLLADGSLRASQRLGSRSRDFAVQAGGQELAMHDGRNDPGFTLHAVVEPTPGRHTLGSYLYYEMFQLWRKVDGLPPVRSLFYPKGTKYRADAEKATWAAACSQYTSLLNGAGACIFGAFLGVHRFPIFEWLNAVTGWHKSPAEYMQIGKNGLLVRQAFNAREGLPLAAAISNRAVGNPPQTQGANRGRSVPLAQLVPLYWRALGWDGTTGHPPAADLAALGLVPPDESPVAPK